MTASSFRVEMRMRELPWLVEDLTIPVEPGGAAGALRLPWDRPAGHAPIEVAGA